MSWQIQDEVWERFHGPAHHKLWLLEWASHADDVTRSGWCPRTRLAYRAGVSERTADRIAAALIEAGVIKREGRAHRGQVATYVLGDLNGSNGSAPPKSVPLQEQRRGTP